MDTDSTAMKDACADILKNVSKNKRHFLKKEYFDKLQANEVSVKSPVTYLTDEEWQALVKLWSSAKHRVCFITMNYLCFADHVSYQ
jgi:hypothetical protein